MPVGAIFIQTTTSIIHSCQDIDTSIYSSMDKWRTIIQDTILNKLGKKEKTWYRTTYMQDVLYVKYIGTENQTMITKIGV